MGSFVAFEKGIEVNGGTIIVVVEGLGAFTQIAHKILDENGLTDIKADFEHWYSQQDWLNAFKTISEKVGIHTLFQIGRKIPENAEFPPEIDSIEKALASIDVAYHMNHRNAQGEILFDPTRPSERIMLEGIGHYHYKKVDDERKAIMTCENPYPCDFDRGIIIAMSRRFELSAKVIHDDSKPCRKNGASSCTYIVEW